MHLPRVAPWLVALAASAAVLPVPATAGAATPPAAGQRTLADLDVRDDAAPSARERRARSALAVRLGEQGIADSDPVSGGARLVARADGFLTGRSDDDAAAIGLAYVRARPDVFGLDAGDLARLRPTSRYTSPDGVTHVAWVQTAGGIDAYDNVLFANVARDGRLVNVGGSADGSLEAPTAAARRSAADAVAAARRSVGGTGPAAGAARPTLFAGDGRTRAAYRVEAADAHGSVYEVVVDAGSGEVLRRRSLTDFLSEARVHEDAPGSGPGGTLRTVDLDADPAWLNRSEGHTILRGNNAHAYADDTYPDGVNAGEDIPPSGGQDWLYPTTPFDVTGQPCPLLGGVPGCTWSPDVPGSPATNRRQATTQLFYLVNRFHDHLAAAPVGFTHAARGFEFADADGAGPGLGGDPVLAESNDNSGTDNANMYTPSDGSSPRMQMYLWNSPSLNSSDAADVVFHEYTHGLTNRSVGTGMGLSSAQSRAMGEGWSDWYALDYLAANGFQTDTAAPGEMREGAYIAPPGIRTQATDCPVGASAAICPGTSGAGSGGYTLGDMGRVIGYFQVHADGEIWAQTLWDLRSALGSVKARGLVTGGLRLAPDNPDFLEMRDAILQAATVAGGQDLDTVWDVFAKRGMGFSATVSDTSGSEAFDVPTVLQHGSLAASDAAPGGDGDGVVEPGETVSVTETLRNPGGTPVTGVSGTLSSAVVTVTGATATWPSFAGGAQHAGTPFAVQVPSTLPCGTTIPLSLAVRTDQDSATLPLELPTGRAGNRWSADVPKTVGTTEAVSQLNVSGAGTVKDLVVNLREIRHTWLDDMRITLTSPKGTTVTLVAGAGGSGDDILDLVLADDAAAPVQGAPAPITGRLRPVEALAAFDGEPRAGTWTLRIVDTYPWEDDGQLRGWGFAGTPSCPSGENRAPVAAADARTAVSGVLLQGVSVLGNDTDADDDELRAELVTGTANGTLDLRADGTFTYRSTAGWTGTDSFTYRARDGALASGVVTVTIDVTAKPNGVPVVVGDWLYTFQGKPVMGNVLSNDSDEDGDPLTAAKVSGPQHGTATLEADGTVRYTPAPGFTGVDSMTYRASDGKDQSAVATAWFVVDPKSNSAPDALDDAYETVLGSTLQGTSVLANDIDADGDALTVASTVHPAHGALQIASDGTFAYTPDADFTGVDSFTYEAHDGTVVSDVATVRITVSDSGAHTPVAMPDEYLWGPLTGRTNFNVLANDRDPDGDPLVAVEVYRSPASAVSLAPDGTVRYTPPLVTSASDASIVYEASDGTRRSAPTFARVIYMPERGAVPAAQAQAQAAFPVWARGGTSRAAARLRVGSLRVRDGRLRVQVRLASAATGRIVVRYTVGDRSVRATATIRRGVAKVDRRLPAALRRATGRRKLKVTYGGDARVAPASLSQTYR